MDVDGVIRKADQSMPSHVSWYDQLRIRRFQNMCLLAETRKNLPLVTDSTRDMLCQYIHILTIENEQILKLLPENKSAPK